MAKIKDKLYSIPFEIYCGLLGLLFLLLIFSVQNVNPLNLNWVLNGGGDNFQHYIGWRFYRDANWTRYLFFMQNLNYPVGSSVIVTDSNPLFSFLFKLLRDFLPKDFQFNGIWIAACYMLSGYFSGLIGKTLLLSGWQTLLLTGFVLLNPVVIQRVAIHDTLAGHWLILAGIYLITQKGQRHTSFCWGLLILLTMLIHIYFLPMILFLLGLQPILQFNGSYRNALVLLLIAGIVIVSGYFLIGYQFVEPSGGSYGDLSMNLNAFINPDGNSSLLMDRPTLPLQYEGFNYFGLGLILLTISGIALAISSSTKRSFFVALYSLLFLGFAVSNVAVWDQTVLARVPLPQKLTEILSTFRSSGRFGWPFYYLTLTLSIKMVADFAKKSNNKTRFAANILLILFFFVQLIDLAPSFAGYSQRFRSAKSELPALSASAWTELFNRVSHIAVTDGDAKLTDAFMLLAADQQLTFSGADDARKIRPVFGGDSIPVEELIQINALQPDTLYILLNEKATALAEEKVPDKVFELDGIKIILVE